MVFVGVVVSARNVLELFQGLRNSHSAGCRQAFSSPYHLSGAFAFLLVEPKDQGLMELGFRG